ncbi:hypothetical protein [Mameliella sediminis]|uniref:hypothetical protein n=1 Tax=Mameliella sediminis TaxID=2836866 RepID=UPI001C45AFD9|nr:hypothetical protein [Mameliella sediminis]MBY6112886.1 hypothetical protein [Antarctobacter heliothermus]MBY6143766.1 hypothetical protein [Mameliella alba]MBV7394168.1 hypothetical protein [Mameliella sediminis]MBY6162420.1 hypothetical protein [Mameliella alba]MBY6170894.1 hypothetical protein [Mameliella alba]
MTYQTTDAPNLRQYETHYTPEDYPEVRHATTRRSATSALGLVVALFIAVGMVVVIGVGQSMTTDPVNAPVTVNPAASDAPAR